MLQSNYDPYDKTLEEFCQYVSSLELSVKFKTAASANSTNSSGTKIRKEKKRKDIQSQGWWRCQGLTQV